MLIYRTNNRAICMSSSERRHCEIMLSHRRTHRTSPRGWTPPSQISPITMQRRLAYDNDSFHYVTTGAESEQPVGAPCYQWVGCRDHARITCFPHSGSWQGGPHYICRDQRKPVFLWYGTFKLPSHSSRALPPQPPWNKCRTEFLRLTFGFTLY